MDETAAEKMDRISATIKLSRNEISEIMWDWGWWWRRQWRWSLFDIEIIMMMMVLNSHKISDIMWDELVDNDDDKDDDCYELTRVGKCQIFYTDQYQQTRVYPEKACKSQNFWHFKPTKQNLEGFLWWINVDELSIYGSLSIDLKFVAHIFPKMACFC